MKTSIKLFALGMILMGFGVNVNAQVTATDAATANARIVSPIALENVLSMEFGNIIATAAGGTVELAPAAGAGGRTELGVLLASVPGTVRAAQGGLDGLS